MLKGAVVLLGTFVLVGMSAGGARADDLFESEVVGIQVADQFIAGVLGGSPWVVAEGEVEIGEYGELEMEVEGLLLDIPGMPGDGTVGPVVSVFASLVCQNPESVDPTNEVFDSTDDVPLNAAGDAEIDDVIELPDVCVAPIVLVEVGLVNSVNCQVSPCLVTELVPSGIWIAASGFRSDDDSSSED